MQRRGGRYKSRPARALHTIPMSKGAKKGQPKGLSRVELFISAVS